MYIWTNIRCLMKRSAIFTDPLFLLSLTVLIINDHLLKHSFPGVLTGKLSDIFGLLALSLILYALLPASKRLVVFILAAAFILWKSPLADPLIGVWNEWSAFTVGRTPDLTDLLALPVLLLALAYRPRPMGRINHAAIRVPLAMMALLAFTATSYMRVHEYDRMYFLPASKHEVIAGLNSLGKECGNLPLSDDMRLCDTMIVSTDTVFLSYTDTVIRYADTLYHYDKWRKTYTDQIDTIYQYRHRITDTIIIHGENSFLFRFSVKDYLQNSSDTLCNCIEARLLLRQNEKGTELMLKTIDLDHCFDMYKKTGKEEEKELMLQAFENAVVQRLVKPQ